MRRAGVLGLVRSASAAVLLLGLIACSSPAGDAEATDGGDAKAEASGDGLSPQVSEGAASEASAGADVVEANSEQWVSDKKFRGTQEEYLQAVQSCLGENGFAAEVSTEEPGRLDIAMKGHSDEDLRKVMDACHSSIGEPNAYLTMTELQARYDWRVEQFDCLVEAGYITGTAKSFESFVADYQRTGFAEWDPMQGVAGGFEDTKDALRECPRSEHW